MSKTLKEQVLDALRGPAQLPNPAHGSIGVGRLPNALVKAIGPDAYRAMVDLTEGESWAIPLPLSPEEFRLKREEARQCIIAAVEGGALDILLPDTHEYGFGRYRLSAEVLDRADATLRSHTVAENVLKALPVDSTECCRCPVHCPKPQPTIRQAFYEMERDLVTKGLHPQVRETVSALWAAIKREVPSV